ncbi:MAG: MFS transporter [bacterium]|nr:MFS transporter [bacterium]
MAVIDSAPGSAFPKGTRSFILITAFLNLAGIGIVAPVLNFVAGRYVTDPDQLAWTVSLLFTAYSLFQFIATPTLGALSDRFGRRPVLLVSLVGSAIGYAMLGIGGALWVLFAGRIIDGITGGNISTIYAYAADISTPQERTRFFGQIGAWSGMGFVIGPALGGLLYQVTGALEAPFFAAALVTLFNVVWGWFVMPESLRADRRVTNIPLYRLNPVSQLTGVFRIAHIRFLLIAILLWTITFAVLQSNIAYLTEDQLGWTPNQTNLLFFGIGLLQVFTQGFLIPRLVPRFGEGRLAVGGMLSMVIGLCIIGVGALTGSAALVFAAILFNSTGNGLTIPTTTALMSGSVSLREQGSIQGGNQSIQALGRVLGPLYAGFVYTTFSAAATYFSAAGLLVVAALFAAYSVRVIGQYQARRATEQNAVSLTAETAAVQVNTPR